MDMGDIMDCIFCKIVNEEIPSYTLYEDEIVKVFLDVNPDVNGHTLIVPKKHYQDLFDIDNDTLMHIKHFHLHLKPQYKNEGNLLPVEEIYKKING